MGDIDLDIDQGAHREVIYGRRDIAIGINIDSYIDIDMDIDIDI